jgi:hypothetical protein
VMSSRRVLRRVCQLEILCIKIEILGPGVVQPYDQMVDFEIMPQQGLRAATPDIRPRSTRCRSLGLAMVSRSCSRAACIGGMRDYISVRMPDAASAFHALTIPSVAVRRSLDKTFCLLARRFDI